MKDKLPENQVVNAIKCRLANEFVRYLNSRIIEGNIDYNTVAIDQFQKVRHACGAKYEEGNQYLIIDHGRFLLTFERIKLMIETLQAMTKILANSDNDQFSQLKKLFEDAIDKNSMASITHSKRHFSYQQGRLSGYNFLNAWRHKTWCQSRANTVFEKCLSIVRDNQKKLSTQSRVRTDVLKNS